MSILQGALRIIANNRAKKENMRRGSIDLQQRETEALERIADAVSRQATHSSSEGGR